MEAVGNDVNLWIQGLEGAPGHVNSVPRDVPQSCFSDAFEVAANPRRVAITDLSWDFSGRKHRRQG